METKQPVRRLCSEIQLFDLCELEICRQKDGRYCTNEEAIARFEAIQEEDDSASTQYLADEIEDEDEDAQEYESDDYEDDEM